MNSAQNTTCLFIDDVCQLPLHVPVDGEDICEAFIPSWYYDAKKKRCLYFVYGGCGGNANRFSSLKSCIQRCMPPEERGS